MSHVLSAVAWPYANGPRHIGHVAGFGVPSDVFSRYMRMAGHDVLMVSGTDEHGTPILVAADAAGVSARELADRNNAVIVQDLVDLGLSYDLFTRTTTGNHYRVVQELFTTVHRNGYMVERTTKGAVSPSTGRTLPDRYIEGTCPICGYREARGDQCDNCGNQLDPTDLVEPRSKINGETPEFVETQHFFLDLPALADALTAYVKGREDGGTWRPNVIKFSLNLIEDLRPRAMTRDIDWGIPVPVEGWRENPSKRLYVWFDAVIGYLSASIEWARRLGEPDRWRDWWNDPETLSYYFMGKDNIVFHSVSLARRAAGLRRPGRPRRRAGGVRRPAAAHRDRLQRVHDDGEQAVLHQPGPRDPGRGHALALPARRVALLPLRGGPGDLGRGLHLGRLRAAHQRRARRGLGQPGQPDRDDDREELRRGARRRPAGAGGRGRPGHRGPGFRHRGRAVGRQRLRAGIAEAMRVVGEVNKYLTATEPYKMKDPAQRERLGTVLHVAAQCVLDCNTLLAPFLPFTANKVWTIFGGEGEFMPMPRVEHVEDLDPDAGAGIGTYPVITGDYSGHAALGAPAGPGRHPRGQADPGVHQAGPAVVEEELARLG